MPSLDQEIDALYAGPAATFTADRNALAKRAGNRAAEVKGLAKPTAAAWAVNQLYWHERGVFDALARASQSMRQLQARRLGGEKVDTTAAEAAHRRALDKAVAAATAFLAKAGDAVTAATAMAVARTLEAVPSPDVQGRLVKPIEPVGFGLLASVLGQAGTPSGPPARVIAMPRASSKEKATARKNDKFDPAASRAEQRRQHERERLQRALADADARHREAQAALERATSAVGRLAERIAGLQAEVRELRQRLTAKQREARAARQAADKAAAERATLAGKLGRLPS
jgi:hypothetical protein